LGVEGGEGLVVEVDVDACAFMCHVTHTT
jgi:hypothetical protein